MATRKHNKSAFVRNQPAGLSAREVVAKAKAAGIALSEKYVWNIRAKAKAAGGKVGKPGRKPKANGHASSEQAFVELALSMGLGNAEALLGRVRSAIRSAVG